MATAAGLMAVMAAIGQRFLPARFLADQRYFDAWRRGVPGAEYPGVPFAWTARVYDAALGWTQAPIEAQAVLMSAVVGALVGLAWHRADARGRLVLLLGAPFLVAFVTPAGKEQLLALALAPVVLWPRAAHRWALAAPLALFAAFIRAYWLPLAAAFAAGLPRTGGLGRGRWLVLCLAGMTLAAGVGFELVGESLDWRAFAETKRDLDRPEDHDTAFAQVPDHVQGFERGVLNSAFAAWQILVFRPIQGLFEIQQWGGYVGLAVVASAWWTVRRDSGAAATMLVVGYPMLLALQLWFEPDLGSMVRHQTPLLLVAGQHAAPSPSPQIAAPRSAFVVVGIAFGVVALLAEGLDATAVLTATVTGVAAAALAATGWIVGLGVVRQAASHAQHDFSAGPP